MTAPWAAPRSAHSRSTGSGSLTVHAQDSETTLDPVTAKAQELGNAPVALYDFVLNQIRPEHYLGSAKSPETVLASGGGNDADQAGLLAALLRAAGFPSRLVWGVREIRTAHLVAHLGVADATAAERLMTSAGIPWSPVVKGGQAVAYRLTRVWCEVWVPYGNFRGLLLDQSGTMWVPLDPEIKSMATGSTRRILEEMQLDPAALRAELLSGSLCGPDLTQAGACPTLQAALKSKVDDYLQGRFDPDSYDTLSQSPSMTYKDEPILPVTMVGDVVAVTGFGLELPESLQHRIRIKATAGGQVLLDTTQPVSALAGKGAVIWYAPATDADQQIVDAYGGYLWDVPAYLVNVTPVVNAGGEDLIKGSAGIGMGRPFDIETTLTTPGGDSITWSNAALTGVPIGIGIAPGTQGYHPAGEEPVNTVEMLGKIGTDYLDQVATFDEQLAALEGIGVADPFPSAVAVSSVVSADGTMGLVTTLTWKGVMVDADVHGRRGAGGTPGQERTWQVLSGLHASSLERKVFEDLEVTAVTADKVLMLASQQAIPIVHVTRDNLQQSLDTLPYDANIESEIAAWVLGGGEADIPQAPVTHLAWTGVGYVLSDPDTGEARYQLAGALSGGMTAVPAWDLTLSSLVETVWPPLGDEANGDPSSVHFLRVDPNCLDTIGVVGSAGPCHLRIVAYDTRYRFVPNVVITFRAEVGGGKVLDPIGGESESITLRTGPRGVASCGFRYGTDTSLAPYYVALDGDDKPGTRVGLNAFRVSSEPGGLQTVLTQWGRPGLLAHCDVQPLRWSDMPSAMVAACTVTASDQYHNPIANADLTAELTPTDGALVSQAAYEQLQASGLAQILLADLPTHTALLAGPQTDSLGRVSYYVAVGAQAAEYRVTTTLAKAGLTVFETVGFPYVPLTTEVQAYWSARPTNASGQSVEGYQLGYDIPVPFIIDVFEKVQGEYQRASRQDYVVTFEATGGSVAMPPPPAPLPRFGWATGLRLPLAAGTYQVIAHVGKKRPDGTVEPKMTAASQVVYGVLAWLDSSAPPVVLGRTNEHWGETKFPYQIEPQTYPAQSIDLVFLENHLVRGLAHADGRGPGTATLGPVSFFSGPSSPTLVHGVEVRLNMGLAWSAGGSLQPLELKFGEVPLQVLKPDVRFLRAPEEGPSGNRYGYDEMGADPDDDHVSVADSMSQVPNDTKVLLSWKGLPDVSDIRIEPDGSNPLVSVDSTVEIVPPNPPDPAARYLLVTLSGGDVSPTLGLKAEIQLHARYKTPRGPVMAVLAVNMYRAQILQPSLVLVTSPGGTEVTGILPERLRDLANQYLRAGVLEIDSLRGPQTGGEIDYDENHNGVLDRYMNAADMANFTDNPEIRAIYQATRARAGSEMSSCFPRRSAQVENPRASR